MSKGRIEAFSDGVFAIVITLLVLELQVPHVPVAELPHALLEMWSEILTYILTFVIVGVYWVAHHSVFHYVTHSDRTLLWINNFFLLAVAFLPFPTSLLSNYPTQEIAIAVYGLTLILANTFATAIWVYVSHEHRLVPKTLPDSFIHFARWSTFGPALFYLLAIVVSFLNPLLSYIIFAAVPLFFILPNPLLQKQLILAQQAVSGGAETAYAQQHEAH